MPNHRLCLPLLALFAACSAETGGLGTDSGTAVDGGSRTDAGMPADADSEPDAETPSVDRIRAELTLHPTYDGMGSIFPRPQTMNAVIALEVTSSGDARGTISAAGHPASLSALQGRLTGSTLALDPGSVAIVGQGVLAWTELELVFQPAGGGTLENGSGMLAARWTTSLGDQIDQTDCRATIDVSPDDGAEPVNLVAPSPSGPMELLPFDRLDITFGEPVLAGDAQSRLAVSADGQAFNGQLLTPRDPIEGAVTQMAFAPGAFYAFGAQLRLSAGDLTDLAGNAIPAPNDTLLVVADPGSASANPSFEAGIIGWIVGGGQASVNQGVFQDIMPAAGNVQIVLLQDAQLTGYFDVPANASSLSLSAALFSEIGQIDNARTAVISLVRANGERIVVFDAGEDRALDGPCMCSGSYSHRLGPVRKSVSITDLRGERVFVHAVVRSGHFIGVNYYALVVDDIVVE